MRTQKQIEASRANGAKSRGPENSNRLRTDLAHTVVLKGESRHRFDALHRSLESELQPETTIEHLLVAKMTVAQWRLTRIWAFEKASISNGRAHNSVHGSPESDALTLLDQARSSSFLSQYETRCDRQFSRAFDRLMEWRAARGGAPEKNLTGEPGQLNDKNTG